MVLRRVFRLFLIVVMCSFSSACVSMRIGAPLVTEGLESLVIGNSTRADVLLALGQPRGHGAAHLSQEPTPREILLYEFVESDGKNVELEILTVYMVEERFDGYLWFASSERVRKKGGIPFLIPEKVVQGYFPVTDQLEQSFVRGETNRETVLAELGAPTGTGAALLPPEHVAQDVLFYEDIEGGNMDSVGGREFIMEMRQRILLVVLTHDIFDGFMWYSNTGVIESK